MKKVELTIEQAELLLDAVRRLKKMIDIVEYLKSIKSYAAKGLSQGTPINVTQMIDFLVYKIQKAKDEEND